MKYPRKGLALALSALLCLSVCFDAAWASSLSLPETLEESADEMIRPVTTAIDAPDGVENPEDEEVPGEEAPAAEPEVSPVMPREPVATAEDMAPGDEPAEELQKEPVISGVLPETEEAAQEPAADPLKSVETRLPEEEIQPAQPAKEELAENNTGYTGDEKLPEKTVKKVQKKAKAAAVKQAEDIGTKTEVKEYRLPVKYTLLDGRIIPADMTLEQLMSPADEAGDALMAMALLSQYDETIPLFDQGDGFYYAYPDITAGKENCRVRQVMVARANNDGENLEGGSFDTDSGELKLPKAHFTLKEGEQVFDEQTPVQVQLVLDYQEQDKASGVTITIENHVKELVLVAEEQTIVGKDHDQEVRIPVAVSTSADQVSAGQFEVYINGSATPMPMEIGTNVAWDPATGYLTLSGSPLTMTRVHLVIRKEEEQAVSVMSTNGDPDAMNAVRKEDGSVFYLSSVDVDQLKEGLVIKTKTAQKFSNTAFDGAYLRQYLYGVTHSYCANGTGKDESYWPVWFGLTWDEMVNGTYHNPEPGDGGELKYDLRDNATDLHKDYQAGTYKKDAYDAITFGTAMPGVITASKTASEASAAWAGYRPGDNTSSITFVDGSFDFTDLNQLTTGTGNSYLPLVCATISMSVGTDSLIADGTQSPLYISVIKKTESYVVLGFAGSRYHSAAMDAGHYQAGYGIYKFLIQTDGTAALTKVSDQPAVTANNTHYSLAGAVYGVFSDSACKNQVTTLTTDTAGKAAVNVKAGNYYVKEITPSKGFLLDAKVYPLTIKAGQTTGITSTESCILGGILVAKRDSETLLSTPQGGARLEGAELTLYNSAGTKVLTLTTDKDGTAKTGERVLPLGSYTLKEEKAPEGYTLEGRTQISFVLAQAQLDSKGYMDLTAAADCITDRVIRGDLLFNKVDAETQGTMAGVSFEIISKATGDKLTITTDKNGIADTTTIRAAGSAGALPYGEYTIREIEGANNKGKVMISFDAVIAQDKRIVTLGTRQNKDIPSDSKTDPVIRTTATDESDGDHELLAETTAVIVDVVVYTGLDKGQQYLLTGTLMDKSTGRPLTDKNGQPVTAQTRFVPEAAAGKAEVVFTFDATGLGGKSLVVFEKLYDAAGVLTASHEDLQDRGQTVKVKAVEVATEISETTDSGVTKSTGTRTGTRTGTTVRGVKTGDGSPLELMLVLLGISVLGMAGLLMRRKIRL